ncbi:MAG: Ig-like domain-containing protein [Flavobacteriaceae bacterium]|jgi:uncharacterized protein (DUF2141 family)|nr:Ig-like domain-containing protein [Flavobacteriaceae bacterium]
MQKITGFLILSSIIISCARVGTPSGGSKDETPPRFLSSKPDTLATKVATKTEEITLNFDEYVVVKDISTQFIISPPPRITPSVSPSSTARKYVSVRFFEPLLENTTYTLNFGSGIQDNNEGNKLENFSYTFSTGDKIDSLQLSGQIKQSLEKNPAGSTIVSLYKVEKDTLGNDSVNLKNKPYYVSRTDTVGRFKLEHLHEGRFRLIAFNDLNSNMIPDTEKEITGFISEIVNPAQDANYDLVLSPVKQPYRAVAAEQDGQGIIKVKFKGNPEKVSVTPVDEDFPPIKIEHQPYADSLYIYFNNKELKNAEKKSRIKFLAQYREKSDTLSALYDNEIKTELTLSPIEKEVTPSSDFILKSNNFIVQVDKSKMEIRKNKEPIDFITEIDSLDSRNTTIKFPIAFDSEYQLQFNAGAFKDFLDQENIDTLSYTIKTKKQSEYGNLNIKIQNKPASRFFFQLMTEKYQVLENIYGEEEVFNFRNLKPGKYLIRILVDENNNGFWDLADLENFIPAEKTYIYPKPVEVRAFWDINEVWIL